MYAHSLLAVSGLLALVAAVPMAHEQHNHLHQHHARDYVWVTETEEAVVTVPVTQTVWLEPGETAPARQQQHDRPTLTSHVQQTVTRPSPSPEASSSMEPAPYVPSTTTSQYVAPSSSSSSVYVPPPPAPTTSSSSSVYTPPPAPTPSSSSSVYTPPPAPTPSSTSQYVAPPAPTTTWEPPTSSAAPPAYTPAASPTTGDTPAGKTATQISPTYTGAGVPSGPGAPGTSFTGDVTYYDPSVGTGSCGQTWGADDAIVALSHELMTPLDGANPNHNVLCGHTITIIGPDGAAHKATITDKCGGCDMGSIDLSPGLFAEVVPSGDGRVHGISWSFD